MEIIPLGHMNLMLLILSIYFRLPVSDPHTQEHWLPTQVVGFGKDI